MRRREFIAGLGAACWPAGPRAQQSERMRRVGVLMGWSEDEPEQRSYFDTFVRELTRLGWTDGGNIRIEQRWTRGDIDRARVFAKELVGLQPDVILSGSSPSTAALRRETSAIPIVFAVVSDPVGAGFVVNLARPGGNITGFINIEASMGGKWLQLLAETAPHIKSVAIMFNPTTAPGGGDYFLASFEAAAQSLAIKPVAAGVHADADIEATITSLGREKAGLVLMTDSFNAVHHGTIISSAARNNVPTIFDVAYFTRRGGLLSYGPDYPDMWRRAAGYVNRVLRGAKVVDLPVEIPTKFELAINLKTAKALGLSIPLSLLVRADEVIE